ncbi:MAG: NAD(P)-dependent oxidoreductase [Candidatus Doudnabacteria bacterium]
MNIVFQGLTKDQKQWLQAKYPKLRVKFFAGKISSDKLPPRNTEILSIHTDSKITREILKQLPELKLIVTRTTGTDHIDLVACKAAGVRVCNAAGQNATAVAEFTIGLMVAAGRSLLIGSRTVELGQLNSHNWYGQEFFGQTLGVVGTGAIGLQVIKIAKAFGMNVVAYDFKPNKSMAKRLGFEYTSLKQVFKKSDVVSLHIPGTPMTKKLINRELLGLARQGLGLINTARGSVVDTSAILKALKSNKLGWYAADVLDDEEAFALPNTRGLSASRKKLRQLNQALIKHPQAIITPHMAHATSAATEKIMQMTVNLILDFEKNKKIKFIV